MMIELRDNRYPCEHALIDDDGTGFRYYKGDVSEPIWQCEKPDCPGGKKITFRWRQKYWHQADPDKIPDGDVSTWFVPCDKTENVWVEVSDE